MAQYAIGVNMDGNSVEYGLFDGNEAAISRRSHESDLLVSPEVFLNKVVDTVKAMLMERNIDHAELNGVGVCLPALIGEKGGCIINPVDMPLLKGFAAGEYLEQKLNGIPVVLDSRCNAATLAELHFGAGRGIENFVYCSMGAGIATAAVMNNKLYRGVHKHAGDTGHMLVAEADGMECVCGNKGCIMSYCGGAMIVKHVEKWMAEGEYTVMAEMAGGTGRVSAKHINIAYERGDALAIRAVEQMAQHIGMLLYNVFLTTDIDRFLLGGALLNMGRKLVGRITKVVAGYNHRGGTIAITNAQLGRDAGIIGAARLIEAR